MENKINEEALCVLKYKNDEIILDYEPIEKYFISEFENIKNLCETNSDNILRIVDYIRTTPSLKTLEKFYKYCEKLDGTYQEFTVNLDTTIEKTLLSRELYYRNEKNSVDYNLEENILALQAEIYKNFKLWISAFNIEKAYRKCFDDKSILTFSHRISGWNNPPYKLSENFTLELKTNFGYGGSSYFFIKIKYKNIEITPFSEWVDYEIAKFAEIIRYTKSFAFLFLKGTFNGKRVYGRIIKNSNWQNAMDFARIACNCSLKNEIDFVHKYIIEECEKMVIGLETIFLNSEFTFKGEENQDYKVDKEGHQLMEFRGEKISGALDFISKILEFDKIAEIKSFIFRLEECNRKIQRLLVEELKIIQIKLTKLNSELEILEPKYLALVAKNQIYINQKNEIKRQMLISKEIDPLHIDFEKINFAFLNKFPEFTEFNKEFNAVSDNYKILTEQIQNLNVLFDNITTYNTKIVTYFELPKMLIA